MFVRGAESILKANPCSSSLQPFDNLPDADFKFELESDETKIGFTAKFDFKVEFKLLKLIQLPWDTLFELGWNAATDQDRLDWNDHVRFVRHSEFDSSITSDETSNGSVQLVRFTSVGSNYFPRKMLKKGHFQNKEWKIYQKWPILWNQSQYMYYGVL